MSREFKQNVIRTSQSVEPQALAVLDRAEKTYRGLVPDNPDQHAADTKQWLEQKPSERGGPKGPEPTRFGDWERDGRCFDF